MRAAPRRGPSHGGGRVPSAATNVLVLNGSANGRERVARRLHEAGPERMGLYRKFDCAHDEEVLRSLVQSWMSEDGRGDQSALLLGDGRSTLFIDRVEVLSTGAQRLLLALLERVADITAAGQRRPLGRLIVGSSGDLSMAVDAGRFLPELYDALNKARVELRAPASTISPCIPPPSSNGS